MDEEYIDRDLYGRGADIIFGKGAAEQTKREALLKLKSSRDAKYKLEPGEYVEWDLYGRGDPRIFGKNGHIANYEEARARLERQQDPARFSFRNMLRVPGKRIRRSMRRSARRLQKAFPCFQAQSDSEDDAVPVEESPDEVAKPTRFVRPPTARIPFPTHAARTAEDSAGRAIRIAIPNVEYSALKNVAVPKPKQKGNIIEEFTDLVVEQDRFGERRAYLRARRPGDDSPPLETAQVPPAPERSAPPPAKPQAEGEGSDEGYEAPVALARQHTASALAKPQCEAEGNDKGGNVPSVVTVHGLRKLFETSDESTPHIVASADDTVSSTGAREFISQSFGGNSANHSFSTSTGYDSSQSSLSSPHHSPTEEPSAVAETPHQLLAESSPGSAELLETSGSSRSTPSAREHPSLSSSMRDAPSKERSSPSPQTSGEKHTERFLHVRDLASLFGGAQGVSASDREDDGEEGEESSAGMNKPESCSPLLLTLRSPATLRSSSDRAPTESHRSTLGKDGNGSTIGVAPSPRTPRSISILSKLLPNIESPSQEEHVHETDSCSSENGRYDSMSQSHSGSSQEGSVDSGTSYMYSDTSGFENVSERHESVSQLGNYSSELEVSSESSRSSSDSSPVAPVASTSDSTPFLSLESERSLKCTGKAVPSPNKSWNTSREGVPIAAPALTSTRTSNGAETMSTTGVHASVHNSSSLATAEHSTGRGRLSSTHCARTKTAGLCDAQTEEMPDTLPENKNSCQAVIFFADSDIVPSRSTESAADSPSGTEEGHAKMSADPSSAVQEVVVPPVFTPPVVQTCKTAERNCSSWKSRSSGGVEDDASRPGEFTTATSVKRIDESDIGNAGDGGEIEGADEFTPVVMLGEDLESLVDHEIDTDSNSSTGADCQPLSAVVMGSRIETVVRKDLVLQRSVTESSNASDGEDLSQWDKNREEKVDEESEQRTEYYGEQVREVSAEPTAEEDGSESQSTSEDENSQHADVFMGEVRELSPGPATEDSIHLQASDVETANQTEYESESVREHSSGPTVEDGLQHQESDDVRIRRTVHDKGAAGELIPEPMAVHFAHRQEPDERSVQRTESQPTIEPSAVDIPEHETGSTELPGHGAEEQAAPHRLTDSMGEEDLGFLEDSGESSDSSPESSTSSSYQYRLPVTELPLEPVLGENASIPDGTEPERVETTDVPSTRNVLSQNESEENTMSSVAQSNEPEPISMPDDDDEDGWSSDVLDPVEERQVPTYRAWTPDSPSVFTPISYQNRANSSHAESGTQRSETRRSPTMSPTRPSVELALEQYAHADITDATEDEAFTPAYASAPLATSNPSEVSRKKSKSLMDTVWGLAKSWNGSAFQNKGSKNAQPGTDPGKDIIPTSTEGPPSVLGIQYDRDTESPLPPVVSSIHASGVKSNAEDVYQKHFSRGTGPSSMPGPNLPNILGIQYDRETESPLRPIVSSIHKLAVEDTFQQGSEKRCSSGAGPSNMPNLPNHPSTPRESRMYKNDFSGSSEGSSGSEGAKDVAGGGRGQRAAVQPGVEAFKIDAVAAVNNSAARMFYSTPPVRGGRTSSTRSLSRSNRGLPVDTARPEHEAHESGAESDGTHYTAEFSSSGGEDSSATSGSGREEQGSVVATAAAAADDVMTTGETFGADSTDSSEEFK